MLQSNRLQMALIKIKPGMRHNTQYFDLYTVGRSFSFSNINRHMCIGTGPCTNGRSLPSPNFDFFWKRRSAGGDVCVIFLWALSHWKQCDQIGEVLQGNTTSNDIMRKAPGTTFHDENLLSRQSHMSTLTAYNNLPAWMLFFNTIHEARGPLKVECYSPQAR